MKKIKFQTTKVLFLMMVMTISITSQLKAQTQNDTSKNVILKSDSLSESIQEYQKMMKEIMEKQGEFPEENSNPLNAEGKLFSMTLDLIGGFSSSNAKMEKNISVAGSVPATSDNGLYAGANVSLNLFGLDFTTGLSFSSKGFKTSNNNITDMSYFNVPLLITVPLKVGDIDLEPSFGPSLGLMLPGSDSLSTDVDLGFVGNVQGTYMFQKHLGALLGFKYEMSGLMNLSSNENSTNIKTNSWVLYTGVRIAF